jgi:hypothetical protein
MSYPPTSITPPPPNPYNIQAVKRYVFNETGNIMVASTEIGSSEIEDSVRHVFAEVAVFFAAMTKAMSTSIDPASGEPYSIYDYKALEGIIDGSGLFVQVTEEDVSYSSSSVGVQLSKELIEALLGLASGEGELGFAQGMIASMGSRGVKIGASSWKSDSRVANIVFVCEYLLGMPIVSAIVVYVDAAKYTKQFKLGPCISASSTSFDMTMHKDTYMFVTPKFIKQYSGDLLSVESDLQFLEFVDYLRDLVERMPVVTAVEGLTGEPAPDALNTGTTYAMVGAFLTGSDPSATDKISLKFMEKADGATIKLNSAQPNVVTFTVSGSSSKASAIGIYGGTSGTTLIASTARAFTVHGHSGEAEAETSEAD